MLRMSVVDLSLGSYEYTAHPLLHKDTKCAGGKSCKRNKSGQTFQCRSGFMSARIMGNIFKQVPTSKFRKSIMVNWEVQKCATCLFCILISFRKKGGKKSGDTISSPLPCKTHTQECLSPSSTDYWCQLQEK